MDKIDLAPVMERAPSPLSGTSTLARAWHSLRGRAERKPQLEALPCIPLAADRILGLTGPAVYRETLLRLIAQARERILIATLYLEDDDAGRELLSALYAAKAARPALQIAVFVDWHRAQRGLIGKARSAGNARLYREMAGRLGPGVPVYGVPVQTREMLGVMHLKGFIFDDAVLYSGASLNDVYLHRHQRYRLDRYHLFQDRQLADSLAGVLLRVVRPSPAVHALDADVVPRTAALRGQIAGFRRTLAKTRYHLAEGSIRGGEVGVTPLLGFGGRDNELNAVLLQLIRRAERQLILYTPYFNLPGPVRRAIDAKIRKRCKVTLILGDKAANDFYIAPEEPFKSIGALPYLYEANLRRFCKSHQRAIDRGLLSVHLWRHAQHTFHVKGLLADDDYVLLTGHNVNPRAWRLDFENALLIHDPQRLLLECNRSELARILAHTRTLDHYTSLETVDAYPAPVQRLLRRLGRTRMDRLLNQML